MMDTREANERDEIVRILKVTNGRVAGPDGAAARMDIKRTTLISRMKKLGIDRARYRGPYQVACLTRFLDQRSLTRILQHLNPHAADDVLNSFVSFAASSSLLGA